MDTPPPFEHFEKGDLELKFTQLQETLRQLRPTISKSMLEQATWHYLTEHVNRKIALILRENIV